MTVMCKIKQNSNTVLFVPKPSANLCKVQKDCAQSQLQKTGDFWLGKHISQLTIYTNLSHRCIKMCIVTFLRHACERKARIMCHTTDIPFPKSSDALK